MHKSIASWLLLSFAHVPAALLGTGNDSLFWFRSALRCQRCMYKVGDSSAGITFASTWCPGCYKILPGPDFFTYWPVNANGEEMLARGEERDFLEALAGDHLFCPFLECNTTNTEVANCFLSVGVVWELAAVGTS